MTEAEKPIGPTDTRQEARPPATPVGSFDFNRPTIVALLYLGSLITGVSGVVGVILAYVWRGESHEPWEATHYTYLIRTFWFGLLGALIGTVTMLILIGFLIMFVVAIWVLVRSVVSLVKAQQRMPLPEPQTLLF